MTVQLLPAEPPLHLGYMPGRSSLLVLAFTGVGAPDEAVPSPEAVRLTGWDGENHVLFISDASRSWMNAEGLAESVLTAVNDLITQISPTRVVAFGNSMGGSAALIFASLFKVDAVLAIVPQYSVNPEVIPEERRWRAYREQIGAWRYPTVPDLSGRGIDVMILHGGDRRELWHARRFAQGPGIDHYVVPQHGHALARALKASRHLGPLMVNVLAGNMPEARQVVESAGGLRFAAFHQAMRSRRKARRQARAKANADQPSQVA